MDVLEKLQREAQKVYAWAPAKDSFLRIEMQYDFEAADLRELLEAAVKEIAHLRLKLALYQSVYEAPDGRFTGC